MDSLVGVRVWMNNDTCDGLRVKVIVNSKDKNYLLSKMTI